MSRHPTAHLQARREALLRIPHPPHPAPVPRLPPALSPLAAARRAVREVRVVRGPAIVGKLVYL